MVSPTPEDGRPRDADRDRSGSIHLVEFMDLPWLPGALRDTLREVLELGNSRPFRRYYDWAAGHVLRQPDGGPPIDRVVELGAGMAPMTRTLLQCDLPAGLALIPCDRNPPAEHFQELERYAPDRVRPNYAPVDFSEPMPWDSASLLVLSATFHHIPPRHRLAVLDNLLESGGTVVIAEPLRRNLPSMLFVLGSLVPALLLPIVMLGRAGRLRRLLWCWALPIVPPMFLWEGWVSCLRQWTGADWRERTRSLLARRQYALEMAETLFCQLVVLRPVGGRAAGNS